MSVILKCDRCGEPFDIRFSESEEPIASFSNPKIRTAEDIMNGGHGNPLCTRVFSHEDVDLCPMCTHQFMLFMAGSDIEDDEYINNILNTNSDLARENKRLTRRLKRMKTRYKC